MLANGLQTKCMGKESSPGQTAESMKASTRRTKSKDTAHLSGNFKTFNVLGLMERNTWGNGERASKTASGPTSCQVAKLAVGNGS